MSHDWRAMLLSLQQGNYSQSLLSSLISEQDPSFSAQLTASADQICRHHYGDQVFLRGLIEITNYCYKNCNYCGLRRDNQQIHRYRIDGDELFQTMKSAYDYGFRTLVMQGGEDLGYDSVIMEALSRSRDELGEDFAITLSIGERKFSRYDEFLKAGANRFLMRIETTDPELFRWLHPDDILEQRMDCLNYLKQIGFEVGSGILFGLPNQSSDSIARDLMFLKKMNFHMVGIGPFCPHKDTPMRDIPAGSIALSTRLVSLIRHLLPRANIPATTAMGTVHHDGRTLALLAGANVLMPNCTPFKFRQDYQLYNGKIGISFDDEDSPVASQNICARANKTPTYSRGDSLQKKVLKD